MNMLRELTHCFERPTVNGGRTHGRTDKSDVGTKHHPDLRDTSWISVEVQSFNPKA
jgi:hypothetical protein